MISILILTILFQNILGLNLFTFFLILFALSLFYQVLGLEELETSKYLKLFKFNNFSGSILFLGILTVALSIWSLKS